MKTLVSAINKFLAFVCVVLFSLLVLTTVWQVFSRLVLNSPVTWSEELAKVLFVWLSFLGAALVYGERGHMAVEMLARKFKSGGERAFGVWTHVVALFFGAFVLVFGGYKAAANAWTQNLTALPVTIGLVYIVIPIAGLAIVIYALAYIISIASKSETAFPIPESELALADGEAVAAQAQLETQIIQEGARK